MTMLDDTATGGRMLTPAQQANVDAGLNPDGSPLIVASFPPWQGGGDDFPVPTPGFLPGEPAPGTVPISSGADGSAQIVSFASSQNAASIMDTISDDISHWVTTLIGQQAVTVSPITTAPVALAQQQQQQTTMLIFGAMVLAALYFFSSRR